ncbi:valine--tRNA ligase, mitochondrial 1 [Andrographis paniculata]|uniref:valine--tRNA ligase, mitochondrial 1 n=1 Tax=Andrographis paniculata TaxID=175694 RepID=UPI0021E86503|nr:valine--tRNA ligase, mitochondrial 1 [Andrographis paniculata]
MDSRELTPEELEKKKKKEEKAREKELKKQKAAQKAAAAKIQAQQPQNASKSEKKKSSKRESEEDNPEDYVDPVTPLGEKKKLSRQMAKTYNPSAVENSWYEWWEKSKFFEADAKSSKPPFVIVLPPPNVTGALHIGHALTAAIEDTIIRWRRMSGYNALWVPGMDHAGIATQVVVEKKIMRELKLTRHDVGRENFVAQVWKWKEEYGGTILKQLRRLGASLDWSRECFTMDEKRSVAVNEAFVRLHKQGLIYRDLRLVNWDCVLRTAISDIEVDYIEIKERTPLRVPGYDTPVEFGVLTSFAYPLEGGLGEIVVATTRVETMLGDTAVAVHPEDPRYSHLHGKFVVHPFNGRKLPIVCDAVLVDMNFGTGAVKITPAHDPNDFEVGRRHNLDFINVFTDDGKINSNGGSDFEGMPRFKARVTIIEALKEKGLYRGDKNNEMRLGVCSRSNDVIEPLIKPQWYVNCKNMAQQSLDAVIDATNPKMEIIPKQYVADWKRWLENIRDWCISRQLWWGHRIPAWYAVLEEDELKELGAYNDHWVVARNEEEAQKEASRLYSGKKFQLFQDPDVLDTWFSSGLFPLSVLGWPDNTDDLRAFYPTSVLETGHDILFFWVARMVMLGITLGGDVPFSKVYLHPMIRDAHGRKMSKSLGNVIDPLEVIKGVTLENLHKRLEDGNLDPNELKTAKEGQKKDFPKGIPECGADALRFALVSYTAQSDKINLDIQRVVGYRQWCNKLWNAIRFAMTKLGDNYTPPSEIDLAAMPSSCKWILSVLNKAISKTVVSLDAYEFSDAATALYSWWQFQLCDVFIEVIKPYFSGNNPNLESERRFAQDTLWLCLDYGLRLLHPFMPFVTEELWQRLPSKKDSVRKESIVVSEYPAVVESWTNADVELEMDIVESVVKSLRSLRSQLEPNERHERRAAFVRCRTHEARDTVKKHELEITTLATLSSLSVLTEGDDAPAGCKVDVVNEALQVFLKQKGNINVEAELEKLKKKMEDVQKQHETLVKKTSAPGYKDKVPAHIRDVDEAKLAALLQEILSFKEASELLQREK